MFLSQINFFKGSFFLKGIGDLKNTSLFIGFEICGGSWLHLY